MIEFDSKELLEKISELCKKYGNDSLSYQIELSNGNTVQICTERKLVFLNRIVNKSSYLAYYPECINEKPKEFLNKILMQVKHSVISDFSTQIRRL